MGDLEFCTVKDIVSFTRNSLLTDIPADTGMPYGLIRFLHNKPLIFSSATIQCFFQYIDVVRITEFVPALLFFYILYFFIYTPKKKFAYSLFFGLCIFFILDPFKLDLAIKILQFKIFYCLVATSGGILFSYRRLWKKTYRASSKKEKR